MFSFYNSTIPLQEQLLYFVLPIVVIIVLFLLYKMRHKVSISRTGLSIWATVTFITGYVVYLLGYTQGGTADSLFALIIRPMLSAIGMFLYNCNMGDINDMRESSLYMTVFALAHFSAVLVSTVTVTLFWGVRIKSKASLFFYSFKRKFRELHIFWGINENSIQLAKDILKKDSDTSKSNDTKVIFVALPRTDDKSLKLPTVASLLSSHSYNEDEVRAVAELEGADVIFANNDYNSLKSHNQSFLKNVGLGRLAKYIRKSEKIDVYMMSYKALDNIKGVEAIRHDSIVVNKKDDLQFYCLAKRENANIILENSLLSEKVNVKFLDSAFLSLQSLMLDHNEGETCVSDFNYKNHPVNFVDVDPATGGVTSKFTSLVLGFGTTGQNVLKFIYEYGAFADPDGNKSPFKCHVFDDNMGTILPQFLHSVPFLKDSDEVEFHDLNNKTQDFWDIVERELDDLNYVVLALGSDNENITVLGELFHLILEKRNQGFHNVHICIRSYDALYEPILDRLVSGYNKVVGDSEQNAICVFGKSSHVFSREMIKNDELQKLADDFESQYNRNCKLPNFEKANKKADKDDMSFYDYQSKRRKQYMNYSNGLHIYTKMMLLKANVKNNPLNTSVEAVSNVSITEHLRWNAATYMMGYTLMTEKVKAETSGTCNEKYRQHICLVPFYDLDDDNRGYDVQVVAKTIKVLDPYFVQSVEEVVKKSIDWYKMKQ